MKTTVTKFKNEEMKKACFEKLHVNPADVIKETTNTDGTVSVTTTDHAITIPSRLHELIQPRLPDDISAKDCIINGLDKTATFYMTIIEATPDAMAKSLMHMKIPRKNIISIVPNEYNTYTAIVAKTIYIENELHMDYKMARDDMHELGILLH